jgi:opacity protein-like surface antigen
MFSEEQDRQPSFSVSIAGAISFVSSQQYKFFQGNIFAPVSPGLFGSVGITYDPITLELINPTRISLSTELSFYALKSEEPNNSNYNSQMKVRQISVLIWTKVYLPAPFSPFVRAGIGVSSIHMQEYYGISSYENIDINGQSLSIGLGGGVDLPISRKIVISVFGDAFFNTRNLPVSHSNGRPWATMRWGMFSVIGLRTNINL